MKNYFITGNEIKILGAVSKDWRSLEDITKWSGYPVNKRDFVDQHLKEMEERGIMESKYDQDFGRWYYRLKPEGE